MTKLYIQCLEQQLSHVPQNTYFLLCTLFASCLMPDRVQIDYFVHVLTKFHL